MSGPDPTIDQAAAQTRQQPIPGGIAGALQTAFFGPEGAQRAQQQAELAMQAAQSEYDRAERQARRDETTQKLRLAQQWAVTVAVWSAAIGVIVLLLLISTTWSRVW